ncbi:hypothetical protein H1C71_018682 [Ictidomys tridecemlineatus]|nr:hypothetical protein H1C71_018682 [Ictidomys tridecemlineatus]
MRACPQNRTAQGTKFKMSEDFNKEVQRCPASTGRDAPPQESAENLNPPSCLQGSSHPAPANPWAHPHTPPLLPTAVGPRRTQQTCTRGLGKAVRLAPRLLKPHPCRAANPSQCCPPGWGLLFLPGPGANILPSAAPACRQEGQVPVGADPASAAPEACPLIKP